MLIQVNKSGFLFSLSNLNQGVATVTSKSTSNGNYVGTGSTSQGSATINYKLPSGKTYVANPKFSVKNLGYGPGTDTFSIIADYTYTNRCEICLLILYI